MMNNIKMNSMIKISVIDGDVIIGKYRGIDYNGVLIKNANINDNLKLNEAHVNFRVIKVIDVIKEVK